MECVQSSILVNTDVLFPHCALGLNHTQKHKRFGGKTVWVTEIYSVLYMLWSARFQWMLTCTLILRMRKNKTTKIVAIFLCFGVCAPFRETKSLFSMRWTRWIDMCHVHCLPSIFIRSSQKRKRERVKKRTRERERPTHHRGPTWVLSFNFHWFKLW